MEHFASESMYCGMFIFCTLRVLLSVLYLIHSTVYQMSDFSSARNLLMHLSFAMNSSLLLVGNSFANSCISVVSIHVVFLVVFTCVIYAKVDFIIDWLECHCVRVIADTVFDKYSCNLNHYLDHVPF